MKGITWIGFPTIRNRNRKLDDIYSDPSKAGSFSGVDKLYTAAKREIKGLTRKQVSNFLLGKREHTRHVVPRKIFPRRKIISLGKNEHWSADLAIMSSSMMGKKNDNVRYWLIVIDTLTRFCYGELLKTKSGMETTTAFAKILKRSNGIPKKLQTDRGTEFYNVHFSDLCNKYGIERYSTSNYDTKAAIAERAIRTIKSKIHKFMTAGSTDRYVAKFQKFIDGYNSTIHRTIGISPKEAAKQSEKDLLSIQSNSVKRIGRRKGIKKGDKVRLSLTKGHFRKGYETNFGEEIFTVVKKLRTHPPVYEVADENGEIIAGRFYKEELQIVF